MKKALKKLINTSLCALLIISFVLADSYQAAAAVGATGKSNDVSYNDIIYYKWTRVTAYNDNDLLAQQLGTDANNPKPVLIFYEYGGIKYYLASNNYFTWDDKDKTIKNFSAYQVTSDPYMSTADEFITADTRNAFYFRYAGRDKDNLASPKYYFMYSDANGGPSNICLSGNSNSRTYFRYVKPFDSTKAQAWSITCMAQHSVVNFYNNKNYFKVVNNISGLTDQYFGFDKEKTQFMTTYDKDWIDRDNLEFYVGTPINYSSINYNYTLQQNQTLNAKDNVILKEGYTLTIEKDAVLCVDGQFYNNGTIINKGTIVIKENSAISPFDTRKTGSGSIVCETGGDIVMLKGSKLVTDTKGSIKLQNGSTLVNSGTIVVGGDMQILDATIDIRENGTMFLGYVFSQSLAYIKNIPVTKSGGTANMMSLNAISGYYISSVAPFEYVKPYATILSEKAKIVNNGIIMLNAPMLYYGDSVRYFSKKNGTLHQTWNSLRANATYKVYTNGIYYNDSYGQYQEIERQHNADAANKKFCVKVDNS